MLATIAGRRVGHTLRCLHASAYTRTPANSTQLSETRDYFYDIDQHGQLFLSNTKIRNFTSCYKDPAFLDFFYRRLKPLAALRQNEKGVESQNKLVEEGYTFISLCGIERNYIRSQDTPIVYCELIQQDYNWYLKWAGSMTTLFQPDALKVDSRGYLYHPSPEIHRKPSSRPRQSGNSTGQLDSPLTTPYGKYSLMRSELVISRFGKSLDLQDDGSGSYEWLGNRHRIKLLNDGEATLGTGWRD